MIGSLIVAVSFCVGLVVWRSTSHPGLAILCGVLACIGLACLYSLLAWIFGWPKFKWDIIGIIIDLWP